MFDKLNGQTCRGAAAASSEKNGETGAAERRKPVPPRGQELRSHSAGIIRNLWKEAPNGFDRVFLDVRHVASGTLGQVPQITDQCSEDFRRHMAFETHQRPNAVPSALAKCTVGLVTK